MMTRLAIILLTFFPLLFSAPTHAQLNLCNDTSYVLDAAIARNMDNNKNDWLTNGWFRIYPGSCEIVINNRLKHNQYYVHARSAVEHEGPIKLFSGSRYFCVDYSRKKKFQVKQHITCRENGLEKTGFASIRTKKQKLTFYLKRDESFHTSNHAMVAGIQRLLKQNGFDIGDIDGYWGNLTKRTILQFQQSVGLPATGIISHRLFDRLLSGAEKKLGVASGLRLCNDTDYRIWAAIGYQANPSPDRPSEISFESKGWSRIKPNDCTMLLREKLAQPRYYLYAEAVHDSGLVAEKKDGSPMIWTGDFPMCLKRLRFKIFGRRQCIERGFQTAYFKRLETRGRSGWTEHLKGE